MSNKTEILKLRDQGKSYSEIREIVGCAISTISYHCGKRMNNKQLDTHRKTVRSNKICDCGDVKAAPALSCDSCRRQREQNSWREMTIGEKTYDEHKYAKYSYIRYHGRRLAKSIYENKCLCGYELHVECCHIKPISDFPPETKLKVVNDPKNLVLLCPNCHWEFDNGLLKL
jgi:hypothetical protein